MKTSQITSQEKKKSITYKLKGRIKMQQIDQLYRQKLPRFRIKLKLEPVIKNKNASKC